MLFSYFYFILDPFLISIFVQSSSQVTVLHNNFICIYISFYVARLLANVIYMLFLKLVALQIINSHMKEEVKKKLLQVILFSFLNRSVGGKKFILIYEIFFLSFLFFSLFTSH